MLALVVGGTGTVGGAVVRNLVGKGAKVRATTRNPGRCSKASNVEWLAISPDCPEVPAGAFSGVECAFLLAPTGCVDQYRFLLPWIAAAADARTTQTVLMTAHEPDDDDDAPFRRAEAALHATSIPGAILRPSWFMQNFHTYWGNGVRQNGLIALPAANGRIGFIDARDIADVASTLLLRPPQPNRTLTLTGPEALNHAEIARLLSSEMRRPIRYTNIDDASFRRTLLEDGMPGDYADLVVAMFAVVRAGRAAQVTDSVQSVTGRPPRTFADYARDYHDRLV